MQLEVTRPEVTRPEVRPEVRAVDSCRLLAALRHVESLRSDWFSSYNPFEFCGLLLFVGGHGNLARLWAVVFYAAKYSSTD